MPESVWTSVRSQPEKLRPVLVFAALARNAMRASVSVWMTTMPRLSATRSQNECAEDLDCMISPEICEAIPIPTRPPRRDMRSASMVCLMESA